MLLFWHAIRSVEQRTQADTIEIQQPKEPLWRDGQSRCLTDERLRDCVVRVCVEIWLFEEEFRQLLDQERAHLVTQRAMSITDSKESLLVAAAGLDHDEDRRARLALERQNHRAV